MVLVVLVDRPKYVAQAAPVLRAMATDRCRIMIAEEANIIIKTTMLLKQGREYIIVFAISKGR